MASLEEKKSQTSKGDVHRLLPCTGTVTSPPKHLIRPSSEVRQFLTGLDVVSNSPIGLTQDQMPGYHWTTVSSKRAAPRKPVSVGDRRPRGVKH
ncbi:hypothetical protein N7509_005134 [Penicillium cosmopolitanum]|uniref:Uncharacterized protein n=1 Tax=Penicillium cosmopolitanum TaxID=1131564 RepID=A0A9X0B9R1_9EURO|nr:uncharacterized protein N7509_005134 [Penicillium cosmopolitanum]KAJ5397021.1 hypothetical protein N7509_005134 [Penicillium cosmopolitanum]